MYRAVGKLGQVQKTYGEVGAGAGAVATVAKAGSSFLPAVSAVPIVGGIIAGVAGLLALFHVGQGCGNACIESAQTEEIFEAATENILYAAKAGMITASQAQAAMQWILQQGDAAMTQLLQSDSKAKGGKTNMDKVIAQEIASIAPNVPPIPTDAPTRALDATALQASIFVQPGTGKYPQSVSAASSLALQAIAEATGISSQAVASASGSGTQSAGIVGQVESAIGGLTSTELVVGLGILGLLGYFALRRTDAR
jgi:hypothetical protein